VDIRTPLVAHLEPAEPIEPGQRALHDPAIAPQPLTGLDATSRYARDDATPAQGLSTPRIIVALIGMQFYRTSARSPTTLAGQTQRRNGVNGHFEQL